MIIENVNGTKQQVKQLYEYVNGVKQPISKRFEYIDGRKQLVYQNKVIKTITLVNANGYPQNKMSGGKRTQIPPMVYNYYVYGGQDFIYNTEAQTSTLSGLNLGMATGKKITKLKGNLWGTFLYGRSWSEKPTSVIKLNNTNKYSIGWTYQNSSSVRTYKITNDGYVSFEISPDMVVNSLSIQTSNLHKYDPSSYTGELTVGFTNLIVEYEDYI